MTRLSASRAAGWGLFAAWAVHDVEEVLAASWWWRTTQPRLRARGWPEWLLDRLAVSSSQFAVAVIVVGVAIGYLAWQGVRIGGHSPLFRAAVLVLGLHAIGHIGQAVLVRGYIPGLVTSVVLVIPYAIWAWRTTARLPGSANPPLRTVAALGIAGVWIAIGAQLLGRLITG